MPPMTGHFDEAPDTSPTPGHRANPRNVPTETSPTPGYRTDPRTIPSDPSPVFGDRTDPRNVPTETSPTPGYRTIPRTVAGDTSPTRWTDPRTAAAYATRLDGLDRATAWPRLTELLTNPHPRRGLGRPDATLVELGSGPGHYAHHLAEHHWTATYALDISPAVHRHGEQTLRDAWIHRILPARDGSLPLRRCQCTGALAHLLFCHIRQPAHILALLTETRRVLRPNAPLALIQPGDHGHDFHTLRYGHHDRPATRLQPGDPYPVDYTLADETRLRTTAYHHPPALLAELIQRAQFRLDPASPERLLTPAHGAAPFVLWTARAC